MLVYQRVAIMCSCTIEHFWRVVLEACSMDCISLVICICKVKERTKSLTSIMEVLLGVKTFSLVFKEVAWNAELAWNSIWKPDSRNARDGWGTCLVKCSLWYSRVCVSLSNTDCKGCSHAWLRCLESLRYRMFLFSICHGGFYKSLELDRKRILELFS